MKKIVFLFVLSTLICSISCEKEQQNENQHFRIKSYHMFDEGTHFNPPGFIFVYDEEGKIKRINDTQYYYRTDGKVDYTRRGNEGSVYREQFHWDDLGRLSQIVVDSMYIVTVDGITLHRNVSKAQFSYEGNKNLPSSISYFGEPVPGLGPIWHTKRDYSYEGENVRAVVVGFLGDNVQTKTFYKISNRQNVLYDVYKQLGFNPLYPFEVVSKNAVELSYSKSIDVGEAVTPQWDKATKYETVYNEFGKPVHIKIHRSKAEPPESDISIMATYE
jgi:hypothetical protein